MAFIQRTKQDARFQSLRGSVVVKDLGELGSIENKMVFDSPDGAEWLGPSKLVLKETVGDAELNKRLTEFILRLKESEPTQLVSNRGGWQSDKGLHRHDFPDLTHFKTALEPLVLGLFARGVIEAPEDAEGPPSFSIADLWANVLGPGDSNVWHSHCKQCRSAPGTSPGISGVYYVSLGNSGPAQLQLLDEPFQNSGNTSLVEVVPQAGQAVVFPSWMQHAVTPHRDRTESGLPVGPRISIAFNLVPRWFSSRAQRAAFLGNVSTVAQFLETDGNAKVHIVDSRGLSLLHRAAEGGHVATAMLLVEHRAKVSISAADGRQPIHKATDAGHLELVQLLIDHRANVTATGVGGQPIHAATKLGNLKLVEFLLRAGAEARAKGGDGNSEPLHLAAAAPAAAQVDVVKALLEARAGAEALQTPDGKGWLPLHHAAFRGNANITQVLLASRADPAAPVTGRRGNGNLPIHLAAQRGSIPTLEALMRAPLLHETIAAVSWQCARGAGGSLPLEQAEKQGHTGVVQWFSEKGAKNC